MFGNTFVRLSAGEGIHSQLLDGKGNRFLFPCSLLQVSIVNLLTAHSNVIQIDIGVSGSINSETISTDQWGPLETCCFPWTWWCNDVTPG